MIPNDAIRANIRDDKVHQIYSTIQTGGKTGMRTMNQSLLELYKGGRITYETALQYTHNMEDMKKTFQVAGAV
jgi:twitching motility protein PilT